MHVSCCVNISYFCVVCVECGVVCVHLSVGGIDHRFSSEAQIHFSSQLPVYISSVLISAVLLLINGLRQYMY